MQNSNIKVSFENRILYVKLLDNVVVTAEDLNEIYSFANERANGKPYGVIFEAVNHYKVTGPAVEYIVNNPNNEHVLAKAYVINTKEAEIKTKAHLLFDNPSLKPFTFSTPEIALKWMTAVINNTND